MQVRLITAPVYEPFTLSEVKDALRVTHNFQDDLIWTLARSARKMCEDAVRISICPQGWIASFRAPMRRGDEFGLLDDTTDPERMLNRLGLPRPPIVAVASVTLVHRDGTTKLALTPIEHWTFDPNWGVISWSHEGRRWLTDPYYPQVQVAYTTGFPILCPQGQTFDPANPMAADRNVRQVQVEDYVREAIFVAAAQGYDDPDALASTLPKRSITLLKPLWNAPRMLG